MSLDALASRLALAQPVTKLVPRKSAGVAVVFRDLGGGEVLLIRRAERDSDPWSGQVAFPGGMVSLADFSFEETARRETAEELGLDLAEPSAKFLGYMREFRTQTRQLSVVPSLFKLVRPQEPKPNREVATWEWAALKELAQERSSYPFPRSGSEAPLPSIVHGPLIIWGLTERVLSLILNEWTRND